MASTGQRQQGRGGVVPDGVLFAVCVGWFREIVSAGGLSNWVAASGGCVGWKAFARDSFGDIGGVSVGGLRRLGSGV